ncbi:MAG: sigma-70 family RNA polymerase sigma factor [Candidatus Woesearchaeota archaeon]
MGLNDLLTVEDTKWVHEQQLIDYGMKGYLNKLVWSKDDEHGSSYLACEVKGMLLREGLVSRNGYSGFVDPLKLATTLARNYDMSVGQILGRIEEDQSLWDEYVEDNQIQRGVPAERVSDLFYGKSQKFSIEHMDRVNTAVKEDIPPISIDSTNCNPFQALAYLLENVGKKSAEEMAYEIGEDTTKIELFLYKNDFLVLTEDELSERLARYKKGDVEFPSTFSDKYDDMSISEFVKKTNVSYGDTLKLTHAGLLESYVTYLKSEHTGSHPVHKITGRSIIYHLRELRNEEYQKKVDEALAIDDIPWDNKKGKELDSWSKYGVSPFKRHINQLKKIPVFTREEEKAHFEKINQEKDNILSEVASTKYMQSELEKLCEHAEKGSRGFLRAYHHKILDGADVEEVRENFLEQYSRFKEGEADVRSLDLSYRITERVVRNLKNVCWDLRILDQKKATFDEQINRVGSASDHELARRVKYNRQMSRKIQGKKESLLNDFEMTQEELESKMERIVSSEANIEHLTHELVLRNARILSYMSLPHQYSYSVEGLMHAAELFDPKKGNRFMTYALSWIRQSIKRSKHNTGSTIRKPVHIWSKVEAMTETEIDFMHQYKRPPTMKEHWKVYNEKSEEDISFKRFQELKIIAADTVSLDSPVNGGNSFERNESSLIDFIEGKGSEHYLTPEKLVEKNQLKDRTQKLMAELTARESKVLRMRFGIGYEPHSLEEVGSDLEVTRERVRQLEKKGLNKLKHYKRSRQLKPFS